MSIPCYIRVHIIGHEEGEDPNTHSKVVLYRTVVKYNGQSFERALRFSRFYAFHRNLTPKEKKNIQVKFPHRYPFVAELDERRLGKRQDQLNAFFKALCDLPITPTMELSLLNLFKIKERHLASHIRGSILIVPNPRPDGRSSNISTTSSGPILRIFNSGSSSISSRMSINSQSSLASNLSYGNSVRSSYTDSNVTTLSCGTPPLSTTSWATASTMSEILEDKSETTPAPAQSLELMSISPNNYAKQIQSHMTTIDKMLSDEDLHLLSPAPIRPFSH